MGRLPDFMETVALDEGPKPEMRLGFVLLEKGKMNWLAFFSQMQSDWGIVVEEKPNAEDVLVFNYEDMMVAVSFIPAPVKEAVDVAKNNVFWTNGAEEVKKHGTHAIVAVMHSSDSLAQSTMYSMVAASLLKLPGAVGIYQVPTVLPADYFTMVADSIKEDVLPVPTWVYFGIYPDGEDFSGYTYGLGYFGKDEIEVIRTKAEPMDLYDFLMDVAYYVINEDVVLHDGETLGFSDEQKLQLTRSDGVAVEGMSIKIGF